MRTLVLPLCLLLLGVSLGNAQEQPKSDPAQQAERAFAAMRAKLEAAKSLDVEFHSDIRHVVGRSGRLVFSGRLRLREPAYRLELEGKDAEGGSIRLLVIDDGKHSYLREQLGETVHENYKLSTPNMAQTVRRSLVHQSVVGPLFLAFDLMEAERLEKAEANGKPLKPDEVTGFTSYAHVKNDAGKLLQVLRYGVRTRGFVLPHKIQLLIDLETDLPVNRVLVTDPPASEIHESYNAIKLSPEFDPQTFVVPKERETPVRPPTSRPTDAHEHDEHDH